MNLNNKAGLHKTIDSVITQTYKDFEWIIIDGGSTDGSKELIEKYADRFVYWVSEPDKGIYNAMNKGIREAKGDYLLFLNSGDSLFSNSVLSDIFTPPTHFSGENADVIYGNMASNENGERPRLLKQFLAKADITLSDLYKKSLPHQATFIRRSLFKKYGLYDESLKILSDRKFFIKAIGFGGVSVSYRNIPVAYFDGNGISSTDPTLCGGEIRQVLDELYPSSVRVDVFKAISLNEVCRRPFFRFLYASLYRCAVLMERLKRK